MAAFDTLAGERSFVARCTKVRSAEKTVIVVHPLSDQIDLKESIKMFRIQRWKA
jgi:hypothetical protein